VQKRRGGSVGVGVGDGSAELMCG